jgi:hypothetical protein
MWFTIFSAPFSSGGVTVRSFSAGSWRMMSAVVFWAIVWPCDRCKGTRWTMFVIDANRASGLRSGMCEG